MLRSSLSKLTSPVRLFIVFAKSVITKAKTLTHSQTIGKFGKIQITEFLSYNSAVFLFLLLNFFTNHISFPQIISQKYIKFDLLIPFHRGNHCS